ncbi:MAG: dipeptide epimerase [Rhodobiaceae bacterium]|nr:dipeptide epimerase [Rhodobiaceae bacterium]MCC0055743.1 dipeptide epimerase [Rhodobiaceae bacterium]
MALKLETRIEQWPLAGRFTISRGSISQVAVISVKISNGPHVGRGECRPYSRYGETLDGVRDTIDGLADELAAGLDRQSLQTRLPAGAARNALDCALWDLEAKQSGIPVWQRAELDRPVPLTTAYTLSLETPEVMAEAAAKAATRPLLKVKLGRSEGDMERLAAVRRAAPLARLIVDANEGWTETDLPGYLEQMAALGVELVEQPLPAGRDEILSRISRPIPVCADESAHDRASLSGLPDRYDMVNVKLDKSGGLTEALAMIAAAREAGLGVFVGCMLATSLSMAPAALAAQRADYVDLDGPLLLARDHQPPLAYEGSLLMPPSPALWG